MTMLSSNISKKRLNIFWLWMCVSICIWQNKITFKIKFDWEIFGGHFLDPFLMCCWCSISHWFSTVWAACPSAEPSSISDCFLIPNSLKPTYLPSLESYVHRSFCVDHVRQIFCAVLTFIQLWQLFSDEFTIIKKLMYLLWNYNGFLTNKAKSIVYYILKP